MTIDMAARRWAESSFYNNNSEGTYTRINVAELHTGVQFHPIPMKGRTRVPVCWDLSSFGLLSELNRCVTISTLECGDNVKTPAAFFQMCLYTSDRHLYQMWLKDDSYLVGKGTIIDERNKKVLVSCTFDVFQDKMTSNGRTYPYLKWDNPTMHINPDVCHYPRYRWLWTCLTKYVFTGSPAVIYHRRSMNRTRKEDFNREMPISFRFCMPQCVHIAESPALDDTTFDERVSNLCLQELGNIEMI